MPPQPTTHTSQWYHGTLNRAESERIIKHVKSILENEVNQEPIATFRSNRIFV